MLQVTYKCRYCGKKIEGRKLIEVAGSSKQAEKVLELVKSSHYAEIIHNCEDHVAVADFVGLRKGR